MRINKATMLAARQHADSLHPKESCGLVVKIEGKQHYWKCRNTASNPESFFRIHQDDACAAEDAGTIQAIVHSHPNASAEPSMADKVQCELHKLPWLILGHSETYSFIKPSGFIAPLLGRPFHHGILDCYSACRDYYSREHNLQLPDYPRDDLWWENKTAKSLYVEQFKSAGFIEVTTPQPGDALLMRVGKTYHINHAAIYLGANPNFTSETATQLYGAGPFIYHHLYGRLASRDIIGPEWLRRTEVIVRHKVLFT